MSKCGAGSPEELLGHKTSYGLRYSVIQVPLFAQNQSWEESQTTKQGKYITCKSKASAHDD